MTPPTSPCTTSAQAVIERGKVRWRDVAIYFLRAYHYLLRRLTFVSSRLEEVLADRVAVLTDGPPRCAKT